MFVVICVLNIFSCDIGMINIIIHDFVVILLCGIILLFMVWYSCHNVFNKKNISTFDVLTFIQVCMDKNKDKMGAYKKE